MIINKEILKSLRFHKIKSNIFKILLRVPPKIFQYIFLDQKKLNKNFEIIIENEFEEELYNKINIIQNIKKLDFSKNFVLSALNLAFLGSFSKNEIKLNKNLINWPDGVFSKIYKRKLKKIPGREVLKNLKINKKIKRICVLGNLSENGKKYLKDSFNLPIKHKILAFGDFNTIVKNLKINIKKQI